MSKRIGFFGGTFDPIHLGHLNLAVNLLEIVRLDEILFSPANISPGKSVTPPLASKKDRRRMTELAIADMPAFSLYERELEREGPSYTIDTIKQLLKENPKDVFFLILGEDVLAGLPKWKDVDELLKIVPPLVGTRPNDGIPDLPSKIHQRIEEGRVEIPVMEISSTALRERLLQKKYCGHWIPRKVLDYIHEKGLY